LIAIVTVTIVTVDAIRTICIWSTTGSRCTLIDVSFAPKSSESGNTLTGVADLVVNTRGIICTVCPHTVVDICNVEYQSFFYFNLSDIQLQLGPN
jgi:hypothetical protein